MYTIFFQHLHIYILETKSEGKKKLYINLYGLNVFFSLVMRDACNVIKLLKGDC